MCKAAEGEGSGFDVIPKHCKYLHTKRIRGSYGFPGWVSGEKKHHTTPISEGRRGCVCLRLPLLTVDGSMTGQARRFPIV